MAEEINAPEEMFQSWDGKPIYAKKAERDVNGNPLELTIVDDVVTAIGGKSVGGGGGGSDIPDDGDVGQVLTKTQDGYDWEDTPSELPTITESDTGKLLKIGSNGDLSWDTENFVEITDFSPGATLSSSRVNEIFSMWENTHKIPYIKCGLDFLVMANHIGKKLEFISVRNSVTGRNGYASISTRDGSCAFNHHYFSYAVNEIDASISQLYYVNGSYRLPLGETNAYVIADFSKVSSIDDTTPITITVSSYDFESHKIPHDILFIKNIKVSGSCPITVMSEIPSVELSPLPGSLTSIAANGDYWVKIEGDMYKVIQLGVQEKISQFDNDANYVASTNAGSTGQVLTKTQNGVAWSDPESASLPVSTESDSVLYTAEPNGEAAWAQMEKTVYGSVMTDEEGTPILDEEGKTIQDEDTATLWTGFNGNGFGAERAVGDENGNNIVATYATKADVETALGDIETLLAAI